MLVAISSGGLSKSVTVDGTGSTVFSILPVGIGQRSPAPLTKPNIHIWTRNPRTYLIHHVKGLEVRGHVEDDRELNCLAQHAGPEDQMEIHVKRQLEERQVPVGEVREVSAHDGALRVCGQLQHVDRSLHLPLTVLCLFRCGFVTSSCQQLSFFDFLVHQFGLLVLVLLDVGLHVVCDRVLPREDEGENRHHGETRGSHEEVALEVAALARVRVVDTDVDGAEDAASGPEERAE